jgi:cell wall-associated NlpC family hydrolase
MPRQEVLAPVLAAALAAALSAAPAWAAPDAQPAEPAAAEPAALVQRVRDTAGEMVIAAMGFLGMPYRRGGNGEEGFDCSGFTRAVFEKTIGLVLPRRADQQAHEPGFIKVAREQLQAGDLVFFNTMRRTFSHVGIYVGDGKFIHAPRSGGEVRIEDMRSRYWSPRFDGARRADPMLVAFAAESSTGPTTTP